MTKEYTVISIMEVDYVTTVELPEGATQSQIIQAAEDRADWDVSDVATNTGAYYIDGDKVS